ncbi:MAG: isocitrate/isopropylmalate family dehydrogenase [Phycisphaerales bacterium]
MPPQLCIAMAPGDGIGPEIMDATLEVFKAAGVLERVEFIPVSMGRGEFEKGNTRGIAPEAIRRVEECGLLFKGPMETPKGGGGKSINVTARKLWNAYANLRHFRTLPGVQTVYTKAGIPVNFYIVRENIEDTYGGIEQRLSADVIQNKRLVSAPASDEVHRFAFSTATRLGLGKVHCGHKANIMKMTDGLFLERFRAVAAGFPGIETGDVIIDALCMNLVMRPQQYDLVVLPNLQGDIVSDLAAGLVGGLGFAPSANIGKHISIFEAVHGTAPDIAGKGVANPTALVLSGLMMLRHIGLLRAAAVIENALLAALEAGVRTGDFGNAAEPALGTRDFARAVVERFGSAPMTVKPVPVPEQDGLAFERPARPAAQPLIRSIGEVASRVAGCDLYLDTTMPPAELAKALEALAAGMPLRLTVISNRGTQVWPTGSVFTELVDCHCARFEAAEGGVASGGGGAGVTQQQVLALAGAVASKFTVSAYELLRTFGGVRGYSLAQGQ